MVRCTAYSTRVKTLHSARPHALDSRYDEIVAACEQAGLQIVARLDRPPDWSRQDNSYKERPPDNPEDYGDFVYAFVARYAGRIDDSDVRQVTSHDARNAIEALLAGSPVPVEKTRVFGCSTKWSDKRASAKESLAKWDAEPVALESISEEGVKSLVRNESQKLRLINVWATWCGPCVTEMPELVTINRMYRKRRFEMFTISIDEAGQEDRALEVLKENHVSSVNYHFAGGSRDTLAEALDAQWPGPVPYTILVAPGGKIIYRGLNEIKPLELKQAIVEYLGRTYANR